MDRLEAMSMFVAAVDSGSLAAAARKLGRSPATVTRAVAQLEGAAGERLLERSTRHLSVTEAGARHVESYRLILRELAHIEQRAEDMEVNGSVVITAPELFGRLHVMPVIEDFLSLHPQTRIRLHLSNHVVDLVGEGFDIAIRLAHLPDSSLTAARIGNVRKRICAAPRYLSDKPALQHPSDLANHVCIGLNENGHQELWRYRESGDARRMRSVRVTCKLSVNSAAAAIDAAEHGIGIVQVMSYQVERQIEERSLIPLLEEYALEPVPVHLVFQSRKGMSSAAKAFIDHATPIFRSQIRRYVARSD